MPRIIDGMKKATEKAAEKTSDLTRQAASEIKAKTSQASGDLKDQIAEQVSGLKDGGLGKLADMIEDLNAAVPVLSAAGFQMADVKMKLVPPGVSVDFDISGDVSEEKLNSLLKGEKVRKMATVLLKALTEARRMQSQIKLKDLVPRGLTVEVGLIPNVGVKFGRSKEELLAGTTGARRRLR